MMHIHLCPNSPQSLSVLSNSTFLLTHPYKASLPLYSACFVHHLPFLSSSRIPFTPSLQTSCYFQHWTPIIPSLPLILSNSYCQCLILSCPVFFLLSIIYKALLFLLQHTFFVTASSISLSHSVRISLTSCSRFTSLHFYPTLFAHPHTFKA